MSENGEQTPQTRLQQMGTRPPEPEHLPCPRCDSTNTKFCYYNNYNLSQPRHFCKSCRRYWTRGGTLRNVPVGGGTRKSTNKRSRTNTVSSSSSCSTLNYDPIPTNHVSIKHEMGQGSSLFGDLNLNETMAGGFTSLLSSQEGVGLNGFGLHGLGFGVGLTTWDHWPTEQASGEGNSGGNTWQMGGVEGGLTDGDCFGWPDLAISTPGKSVK